MHRRGDTCLKVEEGRYVASKIPGSRFVEFEGNDHLPFVGDQDGILDEIERFVAGTLHDGEYDRVLATVMNIRIADLSAESKKRNKNEWKSLLGEVRKAVAQQLELFRGREVSYDKSGMIATFDGPARAIRCASAIAAAAETLGIDIRSGLHTGECDVSAGIYSGFAVELAREIANHSENGKILVSRTVKDLVAGSGLQFDEHSRLRLVDAENEWPLFEVRN
jgi:class 3 adenylate cyclase